MKATERNFKVARILGPDSMTSSEKKSKGMTEFRHFNKRDKIDADCMSSSKSYTLSSIDCSEPSTSSDFYSIVTSKGADRIERTGRKRL